MATTTADPRFVARQRLRQASRNGTVIGIPKELIRHTILEAGTPLTVTYEPDSETLRYVVFDGDRLGDLPVPGHFIGDVSIRSLGGNELGVTVPKEVVDHSPLVPGTDQVSLYWHADRRVIRAVNEDTHPFAAQAEDC